MAGSKRPLHVVGATCEGDKVKNTRTLSSEELANLSDDIVALRIYYLIANGSERTIEEFEVIGKLLYGFAIQLSNHND